MCKHSPDGNEKATPAKILMFYETSNLGKVEKSALVHACKYPSKKEVKVQGMVLQKWTMEFISNRRYAKFIRFLWITF